MPCGLSVYRSAPHQCRLPVCLPFCPGRRGRRRATPAGAAWWGRGNHTHAAATWGPPAAAAHTHTHTHTHTDTHTQTHTHTHTHTHAGRERGCVWEPVCVWVAHAVKCGGKIFSTELGSIFRAHPRLVLDLVYQLSVGLQVADKGDPTESLRSSAARQKVPLGPMCVSGWIPWSI